MSNSKNYYWRIAGFYFFYYAFVGLFAPYWSLYLKSIHFDAIEIAILIAVQPVMRMMAPTLWGWLADRTGKRLLVVQIAATLSALSYLGVFATTSFWGMFLVLALMGFFWSASMPLVEATTLTYLGKHSARYGRIRSWGSVGFIASVVGLGYAFDHIAIYWLLWAGVVCELGIVIFARQIPPVEVLAHHTDHQPVKADIAAAARAGPVRRMLPDVPRARSLLHLLLDLPGRTRLCEKRGGRTVGAGRDLRDRRVLPDAVAGAPLRLYPHPAGQFLRRRAALHADRLGRGFPVAAAHCAGAACRHIRRVSRRIDGPGA